MADHEELKPAQFYQPLINSIPTHLVPRLDPTFVRYYNAYQAGRLVTHQIPIDEYRKNPAKYLVMFGKGTTPESWVGRVTDVQCPVDGASITLRVYEPHGAVAGPRPVYINFHGGGWVFGDLSFDANLCRRVVKATGAVVVDVDYRLAPHNPWPVPVEDCWAAFNHVRDVLAGEYSLDLERVAVGGASAGGHLSAIVSQRARDRGIKVALQMLHVPVCDMDQFDEGGSLKKDCPYESYREFYDTATLNGERMEYFARSLLGTERKKETYNNPSVSPIKASSFKDLAPACVITAEMDPLVDEGKAYYQKLKDAGVPAEYHELKTMPHFAALLDDICEGGREYFRLVVKALGKAYGVDVDVASIDL